ncbi:transposase [Permianibacter aggregans]|uniref:Transposase IS200-like domain-containing protein n=1 Tax=Permianibacter aggregans TaxID=1510150 RepID=A0A4R6UYY8_9GAMM|nr:transposase [Permianibacter aggregans]QGX41530.1 transposase [Permianibacter aggregans]TDQ51329.1 hypothetical protein EV696_101303 [Permianibacter aggregans]
MTRARSSLVSLSDTPYYHVVGRCVRRAFLCGFDKLTNQDYSHRKIWVLERLRQLSSVFCIELCAYAVMSNHYHLVVHVNAKAAEALADIEVMNRWQRLFSLPVLASRYAQFLEQRIEMSEYEIVVAKELVATWRSRLMDLSWYMRCLNEHIARQANEEDGCKGRFWEGRFKSQAILDEAGLLACMVYVDLNPIRAGIVSIPELSDATSIQQRIGEWKRSSDSMIERHQAPINSLGSESITGDNHSVPLLPLTGAITAERISGVPYPFKEYLELVDWTGRCIRIDKRGHIASTVPPILRRLNLDAERFVRDIKSRRPGYGRSIGLRVRLRQFSETIMLRHFRGWGLYEAVAVK